MQKIISSYKDLDEHKCLLFIVMLYVVITTVPSLFLYRLIEIGPFIFPGGMFIYPLIYVLGDVLAEVYGYKIARAVIWYSLICNFIFAFAILSIIFLPYPKGYSDIYEKYLFVFQHILRGDFANLAGVLAGSFLNIYILTKWKVLVNGRIFVIRSFISSAFSEFIMLAIWVNIAFPGRLHDPQIQNLALSDYAIRLIYALVFSILAAGIVKLIKKIDQIDIFDTGTNFNPFSLSLKDKES